MTDHVWFVNAFCEQNDVIALHFDYDDSPRIVSDDQEFHIYVNRFNARNPIGLLSNVE